jgi:uncharacterized protein (DUF433 family)
MKRKNTSKAQNELRRNYDLSKFTSGIRGKYSMVTSVIVKDPDVLGGTPVFRGTRVPFQALLDYLKGGQKLDEFLEDFPTVSREAAVAVLEEAKVLVLAKLG